MKYRGTLPIDEYMHQLLTSFPDNQFYSIWGCASPKYNWVRKLCPNAEHIVDGDLRKQGRYLDGMQIEAPDVLAKLKSKVIVAVQDYPAVFAQLKNYGLMEDDYCEWQDYVILKSFAQDKIFLPEVTVFITNTCNLSCKACALSVPYQTSQSLFNLNDIYKSIDDLFHYINSAGSVRFSGGEPFLTQEHLCKLLDYMALKFSGQYDFLSLTTNGTIIPSNDCLDKLKEHQVFVTISDYGTQIGYRNRSNELAHQFEERGIGYKLESSFGRIEDGKWFDLGTGLPSKKSADELKNYYQKCISNCAIIYKSRFYNCATVLGASINRNYAESSNDYFDLSVNPHTKADYLRFLKYCLGYCDEGYYNWCDCCNGYGVLLNKKTAIPGEQIKR